MKITLIALHYGEEGSGGARRSYLWAKGLRQAGHDVYVVSPYVTGELPNEIYVPFGARGADMHKVPTAIPSAFERYLKRHLRVWLRWPDPEISWHREIVSIVIKNVNNCDWLITSSPPESAHAIGAPLATALNAKWCAELRDSWIERSHRPYVKGLRAFLEKQLAKRWLRHVDAITSVNGEIIAEAKALAPQAKASEIGHFSEPFVGEPLALPKDSFNLVHAGGFERSDRRRSLSELIEALRPIYALRPNLHLHLMGPLTFSESQILKHSDLKITYHGWVPLTRSRKIQAGADAALLYTPADDSAALPGKYSEYCNLRKPIFYLGSERIKNMAARRDEFLSLDELVDYPKGQETKIETEATVETATQKLLALLRL